MTRFLSTCLAALVLLSASGLAAMAQTPVATADPFMLPINQLVLRIREGNGFRYVTDDSGVIAYDNGPLVTDGGSHPVVPESIAALYTDLGVQDLYYAFAALTSEDQAGVGNIVVVDIRLTTFPDAAGAARLVDSSLDLLVEQAETNPNASRDIAAITDLPDHDQAIMGATGTDPAGGIRPSMFRDPFTRFIAQAGAVTASVKVASPDQAFNDAVARELLAAQLECLAAEGVCVPVPLPAGVSFTPGTPEPLATPVTVTAPGRFRLVAA